MDFQKIQVTKKNTLNVVFKNENGDIVSVAGANIVHKDFKAAVNNLIPHIAIMTEQRETFNKTLKEVVASRIRDNYNNSVYKWMTVDTITIADDGSAFALSGNRILQSGDVIKVESPNVSVANHDKYAYVDELSLAVDAVIYEAEAYYKEQKWGIKEGSLDFAEDDPFEPENLTADQVPEAEVKEMKTKKTKKSKSA